MYALLYRHAIKLYDWYMREREIESCTLPGLILTLHVNCLVAHTLFICRQHITYSILCEALPLRIKYIY